MATITTKFGIGEKFYIFEPNYGRIKSYVVSSITINGFANANIAPEILYSAVAVGGSNIAESDTLTAQEATDIGNAWLAERSVTMFTSAGL